MMDRDGRNPLSFALANATTFLRQALNVERFILNLKPDLVNPDDDSGLKTFFFLLQHATIISTTPKIAKELHSETRSRSISSCY
jgi:hypothetical protein